MCICLLFKTSIGPHICYHLLLRNFKKIMLVTLIIKVTVYTRSMGGTRSSPAP